jgi:hypothetical protein
MPPLVLIGVVTSKTSEPVKFAGSKDMGKPVAE